MTHGVFTSTGNLVAWCESEQDALAALAAARLGGTITLLRPRCYGGPRAGPRVLLRERPRDVRYSGSRMQRHLHIARVVAAVV